MPPQEQDRVTNISVNKDALPKNPLIERDPLGNYSSNDMTPLSQLFYVKYTTLLPTEEIRERDWT